MPLSAVLSDFRQTIGRSVFAVLAVLVATALAGCKGPQSALDPAGKGAEPIAELFWWMAGGAFVVWGIVISLAVYAIRIAPGPHDKRRSQILIIGGGAVLPTVVIAGLLSYGLAILPAQVAPAPEGSLRIDVSGEQWWWRVTYHLDDGRTFETANEIRLPIDKSIDFRLSSPDVVHSFWIPSLGRKLDMIPGRETRLALHPTRTGYFRGVCAEFCGESHALMAFDVFVVSRSQFDLWLNEQAAEARSALAASEAESGQAAFLANGCGACHTIRGTPADGKVGPDLTHVGGRKTLGAGFFANDREGYRRWLVETKHLKPGVLMPQYDMLSDDELDLLSRYLDSLL